MFRTLCLSLVTIAATLVVAPLVTLVSLFDSGSPRIDRLIRVWARIIVRAAGLRLSVSGADQIHADRRYILVANHSSYLDIPVMLAAIPQPIRFLAKASLFRIPVFGWGLRAAGFVPVDRKNRSKAAASFDLATSRIERGNSLVIFPEEGRSRVREMLPFQRGAFLLALKSGLPIVPVALVGTYDALPPGRLTLHAGEVEVKVAEPIEVEGMSVRAKDELIERTRARICDLLAGTRQEQGAGG